MKNRLILGSSSLLTGLALFFFALKSDPSAQADVIALDPMAAARFQIVLYGGILLVLISFVFFVLAATSSKD